MQASALACQRMVLPAGTRRMGCGALPPCAVGGGHCSARKTIQHTWYGIAKVELLCHATSEVCERSTQSPQNIIMAIPFTGRLTSEKFLKSCSYTEACRNGLDLSSGFMEKCLADTPLSASVNSHRDIYFHFVRGEFADRMQQERVGDSASGQTLLVVVVVSNHQGSNRLQQCRRSFLASSHTAPLFSQINYAMTGCQGFTRRAYVRRHLRSLVTRPGYTKTRQVAR